MANRESRVRRGDWPYIFALERPFFPTGISILRFQFYLTQGCHNAWVGWLGKEYKLKVQHEALDRRQNMKPTCFKDGVVTGIQCDACNGFTVHVGRKERHLSAPLPIRNTKLDLPSLQNARTKCYPGEHADKPAANRAAGR